MREILFRAWDKDNKEMFEPAIPYGDSVYKLVIIDIEEDRSYLAKIENAILMQYTGLLDKNGKKIFEGDVLKDVESTVIVKFVDGEFSVDYRTIGGKWRNYGSLFDYLDDYEAEIIGNIHEGVQE